MPVDDFESTSTEDDSSVPSWVISRIHTWLCGAPDNESLNKEHSIDKMFFHDEDCNIVSLCTIEVVSSSEDSSGESQQNMNPNSLESNSIDTLRQLDPGKSEREATIAPNKEESQQVGMHDQFSMMPKMVQQGDKILWNKYPWENSQGEASFLMTQNIVQLHL